MLYHHCTSFIVSRYLYEDVIGTLISVNLSESYCRLVRCLVDTVQSFMDSARLCISGSTVFGSSTTAQGRCGRRHPFSFIGGSFGISFSVGLPLTSTRFPSTDQRSNTSIAFQLQYNFQVNGPNSNVGSLLVIIQLNTILLIIILILLR